MVSQGDIRASIIMIKFSSGFDHFSKWLLPPGTQNLSQDDQSNVQSW